MTISGFLVAKCNKCDCVFNWYIGDAWPFVNSEIVGTCSKCIDDKIHGCVNELETVG